MFEEVIFACKWFNKQYLVEVARLEMYSGVWLLRPNTLVGGATSHPDAPEYPFVFQFA